METRIKSNYRSVMRNGYIQAFAWTLEFLAIMMAFLVPLRALADITVPTLIMVMVWALGLLNIEILHFWLRREARTLDETVRLLQKNEMKYRSIIEQSLDGIVITDAAGTIVEWNRGQKNLSGLSSEEAVGRRIWDVYYDLMPEELRTADQLERLKHVFRNPAGEPHPVRQDNRFQHVILHQEKGATRMLQQVFFPIKTQNGDLFGIITRDVTEQSRDHQRLLENEERFRALFQSAPICYQSLDIHGRLIEVNQAWLQELEYQREEVIGRRFIEFLAPRSQEIFPSVFWRYVMTGELESIEFDLVRKDGSIITIDYHGKVGFDENGNFKQTHCVFFNITERKEMEQEMHRLAVTDALTGLYNRRHYFDLADSEFKRARRHNLPLSAIMVDVDNFKKINDTFGHIVGDQVLQHIAHTCQNTMREIDIIGRYGGDEIVILLPSTNLEQAHQAAERLRLQVEETYLNKNKPPIRPTISLGVAQLTRDDHTVATLQDRADQALFAAKKAGRNRVIAWHKERETPV